MKGLSGIFERYDTYTMIQLLNERDMLSRRMAEFQPKRRDQIKDRYNYIIKLIEAKKKERGKVWKPHHKERKK